jgi:hypothetical protein
MMMAGRFAAQYARCTARYGERGSRYTHMEVGHTGDNLFLRALELACSKEVLSLPPEHEPLLIMPVATRTNLTREHQSMPVHAWTNRQDGSMDNRRALTPRSPGASCHPDDISGLASQQEIQGSESHSHPRPSFLKRLPKFFGWWIIIIGVSSYV